MSRDTFDYTHGDTGSKPSTALNFKQGGRPKAQNFDWMWYEVIEAIKGHAAEFNRLDSNDDGKVEEADQADVAVDANNLGGSSPSSFVSTSGDTMGGDLDLDGNALLNVGSVTSTHIETRTSDPTNPDDGQTWIRTDL